MTGNILAVRHHFRWYDPASWLSWIIRKLDDNCWANHSAILIRLHDKTYVMDARFGGMMLSTFEEWLKHRPRKAFYVGTVKFDIPKDIEQRILSTAGRPYDKTALLFWHPMRLLFGKWWGGRAESGKFVCSELIGWIYKEQFPEWRYLTTGMIMKSGKVNWVIRLL